MAKRFNTVGGGANTNRNGLEFERCTDLREAFAEHELYKINGDNVIDCETDIIVGRFVEKHKLYKKLLEESNIDYKSIISKKLLPDDAILVKNTLYIIEKKYQSGSGSVDEKLQTCHFKRKQYLKLMQPLSINVEYYYLLSDWYKRVEYKDVLDYTEEVGCKYFFDGLIPLSELGL